MKVEEVANKYIGMKEKPGNMGFIDDWFENRMKSVGFTPGHAWCAYFAELCFREALPDKSAELDKLFSAGTVQTFRNFRDAGYPISNVPRAGNLVIWQTMRGGNPQTTGHAGVVVDVVDQDTFHSIEGNTNDGGSREGYIVAKKLRNVVPNVKDGLKVMGFIQIA